MFAFRLGVERTPAAQPPHQSKIFEKDGGGANRSGSLKGEGKTWGCSTPSSKSFPFSSNLSRSLLPNRRQRGDGRGNIFGMDADEHRGSRARAELDSLRERIEMKPDGDALRQPYPLERRADRRQKLLACTPVLAGDPPADALHRGLKRRIGISHERDQRPVAGAEIPDLRLAEKGVHAETVRIDQGNQRAIGRRHGPRLYRQIGDVPVHGSRNVREAQVQPCLLQLGLRNRHISLGGQKLIPECLDKVQVIRKMINDKGLSTDLEVDGGINLDNVAFAMEKGANVIVAGSAVFKDDIAANAKAFLNRLQ